MDPTCRRQMLWRSSCRSGAGNSSENACAVNAVRAQAVDAVDISCDGPRRPESIDRLPAAIKNPRIFVNAKPPERAMDAKMNANAPVGRTSKVAVGNGSSDFVGKSLRRNAEADGERLRRIILPSSLCKIAAPERLLVRTAHAVNSVLVGNFITCSRFAVNGARYFATRPCFVYETASRLVHHDDVFGVVVEPYLRRISSG